ncbi:triose-phosphate transporter family-domain-containing protein [Biscogniauxia marginata]|nr:triose-phosphate transporter family-domain-containing protein [Biscogniauxia marginata]
MVSTRKKFIVLSAYFTYNIGLTIYNKVILGPFQFPWILTALHAGCSSVGCTVAFRRRIYRTTTLTWRDRLTLLAFSLLFTLNIAMSNVSLAMVSMPFHQLVRATTPLVTAFLFRILYRRTFPRGTYLSLIPVVAGIPLATYGELAFTDLGFMLTVMGVVLAAAKTIATNRIMTGGLALPPWEVLYRMSPLAFVQSIVFAFLTGELSEFGHFVRSEVLAKKATTMTALRFVPVLACNGALAFGLNVSSFSTNKIVGALTMTVCGNVKQCATILVGVLLFDVHLSTMNYWGIVATMAGGFAYSFAELARKEEDRTERAPITRYQTDGKEKDNVV